MPEATASAPIRSEAQAAAYLEGLINHERRPGFAYARLGLGPIRALLERLGDPQAGLPVIHIAGSKGKGSTALFAEALLRGCGRRVGVFTSPHLERWTERFRVGGAELSGAQLAGAVERLRPHVDALRAETPADAPTFFDATTAAALLLFRNCAVDCAVVEVGLGGRLDSTNALSPAVTCVTSIELEHTDKLGNTLAEIAAEKAGILEPDVPVVVGALPPEALAVVEARAQQIAAPVFLLGRDFHCESSVSASGLRLRVTDGALDVAAQLGVLGRHQAENATLALACVLRSGLVRGEELAKAAPGALAAARLPGRIELLHRTPCVVVDSAHTAASARALAAALRAQRASRTHFVLSISSGKDSAAILAALLPLADRVTATRADRARSMSAADVAAAVRAARPDIEPRVVADPQAALRAAAAELGRAERLVVAGSVYLAGAARAALRERAPEWGATEPLAASETCLDE